MKRINNLTNTYYKRGDTREDGFFFLGYQKTIDKKGFFYEAWVRPEVWNKQKDTKTSTEHHIRRTITHIKSWAKKNNIPFNISVEYAISIAPEVCPALGTKLAWAKNSGRKDNSPSLDKIIPELGYVEGNVMWLSFLANAMKRNASPEQLKKFAEWILNGHITNTKGVNP